MLHILGISTLAFLFIPYFLPTIIALVRQKRNLLPIILLNFFLGWTLIGWIVALVWSLSADPPVVVVQPVPWGVCTSCGNSIAPGSAFCNRCGQPLARPVR